MFEQPRPGQRSAGQRPLGQRLVRAGCTLLLVALGLTVLLVLVVMLYPR